MYRPCPVTIRSSSTRGIRSPTHRAAVASPASPAGASCRSDTGFLSELTDGLTDGSLPRQADVIFDDSPGPRSRVVNS